MAAKVSLRRLCVQLKALQRCRLQGSGLEPYTMPSCSSTHFGNTLMPSVLRVKSISACTFGPEQDDTRQNSRQHLDPTSSNLSKCIGKAFLLAQYIAEATPWRSGDGPLTVSGG